MRYPGSAQGPLPRPGLAYLIGLLLNIANVAAHNAYDDGPDVVQKSFDVIAVDVGIIDIVSIQRIRKLPITAAPRHPRPGFDPDRKLVLARQTSSTCPSSFSLCPSALSGGCCPTGFACDVSDCVQTSVASTTEIACGKTGYTACGVADGGGCCPLGYTCGRQSCTMPSTGAAAESQSCPSAYYLCPASLGYGCCATSMGCALSGCYSTAPTTVVVTRTYTTATGGGSSRVTTVTSTTVETPTPATDTAGDTGSGGSTTTDGITYVAKLVPTTTAKASLVAVSGSSDSGSDDGGGSGLSRGAIGGLIGGLVALLVAIAVAAYCIIKNVRRTSKELDEIKRLSGSGKPRKRHSDINGIKDKPAGSGSASKPRASLHHPTPSVINHMEVDDLLERAPTVVDGETSSSGIGHSFRNRMRNQSQSQNQNSSTPTPAQPSLGGASSDYFDIPQRTHNRPGHYSQGSDPRISMDSPGIAHARNTSSTSNTGSASAAFSPLAGVYTPSVGSPHQPAELGVDGAFIPELPVAEPTPISPSTPPTTATASTRPRPFSNISAVSGLSYAGFSPTLPQQKQQQQPLMSGYGHQRTWSDSSASTTGGANTPLHAPPPPPLQQQTTTTSPPQPPLGVVVEEHLHGHYGPDHEVAGQTRR